MVFVKYLWLRTPLFVLSCLKAAAALIRKRRQTEAEWGDTKFTLLKTFLLFRQVFRWWRLKA
jgi:hypothetical protein